MGAILIRDLRIATRAGGGFGLSVVFFLITVLLIPFGVGPDTALLATIAPGILWVAALLACLLSLDRLFQLDFEDGALDLIALSPVPLEGVVLAKALAHWLTTGLPLVVASPILAVVLNLAPEGFLALVLSLLLGTPALSLIGSFGAALTVGLRRGGLLLSLLVLPLYIPVLIFGAEAASRGAAGQEHNTALLLLSGLTLFCIALMPIAAAGALRVALR